MSRAEFLRPSSAATWVVCHGYAAMAAAYPQIPDEADDEVREDGIACHWLASEIWAGRHPQEGSLAPNGRELTEEMFDAVDMYHDVLRSWTPNKQHVMCEVAVSCAVILEGMRGTPDAARVDIAARTIQIADLKFGFRFVEVWDNYQLIIYALSVAETVLGNLAGLEDQNWWVELTIVQPRNYHRDGPVRTWRVKLSDLRAHANVLRAAAAQAMKYTPDCTPNPGCVDCPARHACVALQNSAASALEVSYAGIPLELPPAAMGDELRRLKDAQKRIEARITGLEVQTESTLRGGTVVPGWALRPGYARESWREGTEAQVLALASYYTIKKPLAKPARAITPKQARDAGLPADVVAIFAHKPSTGMKLVKRDPYEAMKAFSTPPQGE